MEYLIVVAAFILIGIVISLIFYNVLHIKVFGGWVMMFIIATIGALLGSYYLPILTYHLLFWVLLFWLYF